jgi:hypothetical protein
MVLKQEIEEVFELIFQPGKNMYMHWLLIPFGLLVMPVLIYGFLISTDTFVAQQMLATYGWAEHTPLPIGELLNLELYLCMVLGLYGAISLFVDLGSVSSNCFKKQGDDL